MKTNADKFLRDGVDITKFASELSYYYEEDKDINKFPFRNIMKFLNEEIKPHLTEDERVILKQVSKAYAKFGKNGFGQFIFRIDNGEPFLLNNTAEKIFDGLFQFIKERRRIFYKRIIRR